MKSSAYGLSPSINNPLYRVPPVLPKNILTPRPPPFYYFSQIPTFPLNMGGVGWGWGSHYVTLDWVGFEYVSVLQNSSSQSINSFMTEIPII